ncbi:MAG: 16S rRNA (uracil(1498)-N(3))-methyltransferase, partial [Stellaceae bacterium]
MSLTPAVRLYLGAALAAGATVELGADEAHRLRPVLRLGPSDRVALFNGRDGEWLGRIDAIARASARIGTLTRLRPQRPESDLWLVFALVKRARLELLVEKATELGASALLPVLTRHTVVPSANLARLGAVAREAAEQSERLSVPELSPPQPFAALLERWPRERRLVLCDESGQGAPAAGLIGGLAPGPLAVLVGPEGGFAETELDALRKLPFVFPVGLGPRVLRSETAALAA